VFLLFLQRDTPSHEAEMITPTVVELTRLSAHRSDGVPSGHTLAERASHGESRGLSLDRAPAQRPAASHIYAHTASSAAGTQLLAGTR
jgi:hypothetical protein